MNKLLIITGGSRGLGSKLVEIYKNCGWDIVELSRSGKSRHNHSMDFSKPETIEEELSNTFQQLDRESISEIHIISNAATLTPIDKNFKIDRDKVISNLNINITSSIIFINYLTRKFRDLKIPKIIVNISSGAALKGYSGWSLYCASKAAMENYINSIIIQEEDEENPFTAINFDPGVMDTKMQEEIRNSSREEFPTVERFKSLKENNELRTPESVATLLTKLLSTTPDSGRYSVKELDIR